MKNKPRLLLILTVLLLAALACSAPIGSSDDGGDGGVSDGSSVDSSPQPTQSSGILFQDDFSSTSSGWEDLYQDDTGMTNYDQGGFRIQVLQPNFDYWANPNLSFTDTVIEVDAKKIGGPDDNDFGVICRYRGVENFYFLIVTSDGYHAIGKYSGGEQVFIGTDEFTATDAVRAGDATNQIRAECIGSTLRLYVNGTLLQEVSDSDHTVGDVGLIAGTFDEPGTDILFDNFVVRAP